MVLLVAQPGLEQKIEKMANAYLGKHVATGLAIAIIGKKDHKTWEKELHFGRASRTSQIPITNYTEFRINLITQAFTAATLAYFVQEGWVSLSDPVSKFLPKSMRIPNYQGQEITLGDLATHTSGLPNMPYQHEIHAVFRVAQMYRFLNHYQLTYPPGTRYLYSNLGYAFLSNLLMRIAKSSLSDLFQRFIFDPLYLKETTFFLSREQQTRCVIGYDGIRDIFPSERDKVYSVFVGSGGLYSTASDMLRWLAFNLGEVKTSLNTVLPLMQQDFHTFKHFRVGLGWKIVLDRDIAKHDLYFIEGQRNGFSTYMGMIPEQGIGVVILANQSAFPSSLLGKDILKLLVAVSKES